MKAEDYQENYQSGWIKLNRSIKHHWLFQNDKFFKQWVLMLLEVNHTDKDFLIGYEIHKIKRGQSAKSLRSWAELFNCNVKQVIKFFELLEKDKMISKEIIGKGKQSTTLINITNYAQYQGGFETQEGTQEGTQEKRKGNARGLQYKNVKNDKNEKEDSNNAKAFPNEKTFIDWFNYGRLKLLGKEGKTKVLGTTDKNNFKILNSTYTRDEFKHAVTMMAEDEWVKSASKFTVSHLLVPKNFDKYLNKEKFVPRIVNNQPLN